MKLQQKKISISIFIPFFILALVFGILVWKKFQDTSTIKPEPPSITEPISVRTGVLFFTSPDGVTLSREGRELDPCGDQDDCLVKLIEELLGGPIGDLETAIPQNTAINSAHIESSVAFVDLNQQFADDMLSGSNAEMLAVYSIVNTIVVNFPQVMKVKITVGGNSHQILKHLDIREPLEPDFSLEKETDASTQNTTDSAKNKDKP